jgi:hypothetical protein
MAGAPDARAIILVEGLSDRTAVETLAARRGRDLLAEGVQVVPVGGAQAMRASLARLGPFGAERRVAGLCDAGEEAVVRRAVARAGLGAASSRAELEALGFYVCEADLEDELIRALGPAGVKAVLDAHGDLGAFRTFQRQPAWRGRSAEAQLRRFFGSADSRKLRYARFLVEALDLDRVPHPLDGVLTHISLPIG